MSRIAYVNGQYLPHTAAAVHIEDRGYQFSDGIYEVCSVFGGRIFDFEPHAARLERSLSELAIAVPFSRPVLKMIMEEVLRQNRIKTGIVYIQITRGVAPRDHAFPSTVVPPSVIMTARRFDFAAIAGKQKTGVPIITAEDLRWKRRDIKSVSLLGNVLAKQAAREAGVYEAWMVDEDGFVTEGSSTNAWIVDKEDRLISRALSRDILPGITRADTRTLASELRMEMAERPFTVEEAKAAKEAFLTSTTSLVMPVVEIDGAKIGDGRPGALSAKLAERYWRFVCRQTGMNFGRR